MAARHGYALQAVETNDVFELCKLLTMSAQDALKEQVYPHNDPACKIIAHQIAFSTNGDNHNIQHYQELYGYCARQVEKDQTGIPDKEQEKEDAPVSKAS